MYTDEPASPGTPPPIPRLGLSIAALILGILSVFLSIALVGVLLGFVGLVLGIVHLSSERHYRAMAGWGVALSIVGILLGIGAGAAYTYFAMEVMPAVDFDYEAMDEPSLTQWEGVLAPDMTLPTLDDQEITLSELKGKRVIVALWSTDSPLSEDVMKHLALLASETAPEDLVILGVSEEHDDDLNAFIEAHEITFPIVSQSGLPTPYGDAMVLPVLFFIDRNGVIQTVLSGGQDLETIRTAARADDYAGTPLDAVPEPREGLVDATAPWALAERWSTEVAEAGGLSAGDWDGDGAQEILLTNWSNELKVFGGDGVERATVPLPEDVESVRSVAHASGVRLLGYSEFGERFFVLDQEGRQLWTYKSGLIPTYFEDVQAGDVDSDGNDEFIVSAMNGLHLVSEDGERIWRNRSSGMGNIALVTSGLPECRIFASDFFRVKLFNAAGEVQRTFGLGGEFCDALAATVDGSGAVQLLIDGEEMVQAASETGRILWKAPMLSDEDSMVYGKFCASGDLNGDGAAEWVFLEDSGALSVVSTNGERLASIPDQGEVEHFAIAQTADGSGLLVVLHSETMTAFAVESAPAAAVVLESP